MQLAKLLPWLDTYAPSHHGVHDRRGARGRGTLPSTLRGVCAQTDVATSSVTSDAVYLTAALMWPPLRPRPRTPLVGMDCISGAVPETFRDRARGLPAGWTRPVERRGSQRQTRQGYSA